MTDTPILWSFRRCPYAMRARGAILSAGQSVILREILLRDKPDAFLRASASATVPALSACGRVLDESLDIMVWALKRHDPQGLLQMPRAGWELIARNDGPFKTALDHTKYAVRHPDLDPVAEREKAAEILRDLNRLIAPRGWLLADRPTLADHAIWPFVRQFANTDRPWFNAQPWPDLIQWVHHFTVGPVFERIMEKYAPWAEGDAPVIFGP